MAVHIIYGRDNMNMVEIICRDNRDNMIMVEIICSRVPLFILGELW